MQWQLSAQCEWVADDPFGRIKPKDVTSLEIGVDACSVVAARNGYASLRLVVSGQGDYSLVVSASGAIEADLFRCWYHRMATQGAAAEQQDGQYISDALVPVASSYAAQLPDVDNAIAGQTHQSFWLDLFIPPDAEVKLHRVLVVLEADGQRVELAIEVRVIEAVIPDDNALICDHNSYGCRWLANLYPQAWEACTSDEQRTDLAIRLLHSYYQLCHEHRGLFSNLGVGHAGTFDAIYGPKVRGSGRELHLTDWELFDKHYGPLLDGSLFAKAGPGAPRPRRQARPVWSIYTPINASWPADYLWWDQPGYEVEFNRGVSQFDQHLRDNGWQSSQVMFFFNHKKRYRWYEWDGDEPKHAKDNRYLEKMGELLKQTVGDSPVPWCYRMDASWQMKNQFEWMAGDIGLWVCAIFLGWYPQEVQQVIARGELVWTYSGTPAIDATSSALLEHVMRAWARGLHGHCEWLTCSPGEDPWFACNGASTGMLYPGERFGITGPIPSARLKLQRNAIQDLTLLNAAASSPDQIKALRDELAERTGVQLWWQPPATATQMPPEAWDSTNLRTSDSNMSEYTGLDPLWWKPVRDAALKEACS